MIKSINEKPEKRIEIDLMGPNGNAWSLMGTARNLAKELNRGILNESYRPGDAVLYDIEAITKDMMSGDYEHLLSVMEREFGKYIIMYR
jgi:hypothetical protein